MNHTQANTTHSHKSSMISTLMLAATVVTYTLLGATVAHAHDHKSASHKVGHNSPELGLQLYSLRNQFADDVPATMAQIGEWGFTAVEGGGALYDTPIDAYKDMLDKHHIQVVSADTSFEEIRDNPMGAVFKAKYFGAKYATIYWVPHEYDVGFTFEDAKRSVEILNAGGKLLKQHGITLQYHPHGYELGAHEDGTLLDYIIQNTSEAQFQMDVFWIKQAGADPLAILKKYAGRFTSLHLKDRLKGSPYTSNGTADVDKTNVVLGTGDVGIAGLVAEAQKQGIQYYFIEDESSRVIQQVPKSLQYVKSLID